MEIVACRTSKINNVFIAAVAVLVPKYIYGQYHRCSVLPKCPNGNGTATEWVFNGYPLKTR